MSKPETVSGESIAPLYSDFDIIHIEYKQVNSVGIPASILIPKNIGPGKHPISVHWHAGGFGTGHRLFPDWHAGWTLSLANARSSIIISPDYRLLPQATGLDILEDIKDFYTWLFTPDTLASHLPSSIQPDLTKLLVTGESAGGWCALRSGFLHADRIAAIIAQYPMIDIRAPHYSAPAPPGTEKHFYNPPIPQVDPAIVPFGPTEDEPAVVSNRTPPEGLMRMIGWAQQGLYPKYFGTDTSLYPLELLDRTTAFPPTWIVHGTSDSLVPTEGTRKFEPKFREKLPHVPLLVTYVEGGEHGFDNKEDIDWKKLRDAGLKFVETYWPTS